MLHLLPMTWCLLISICKTDILSCVGLLFRYVFLPFSPFLSSFFFFLFLSLSFFFFFFLSFWFFCFLLLPSELGRIREFCSVLRETFFLGQIKACFLGNSLTKHTKRDNHQNCVFFPAPTFTIYNFLSCCKLIFI